VLPSISCHQFSAGQTLDVEDVVAPEELELLDESSFFAQEMIVRLKQEIRKTNKNFFIFSSIPKVKYYCFCVLGEPYIYHNLEDFTRIGDFT